MPYDLDDQPDENESDNKTPNDSQQVKDPSQQAADSTYSGEFAPNTGETSQHAQENQVKELSSGGSSGNPFGGSPGAGSSAASSNTSGGGQGTSSGSYTNLQDYLRANAGGDFGGQVVGHLNSDLSNAQNAMSAADQGFRGAVDKNNIGYDDGLIQRTIKDPISVQNSADDMSALQGQLGATYAGPHNLSDQSDLYNPAQSSLSTAQQNTQATDSDSGRWALLNQYFGGGGAQYNQGQQALDSALLSADPTAQAGFQQAKSNAQNLGTQWNNTLANDATYAQSAADNTAATAKKSFDAINGEATNELTGYQKMLADAQAAQQKAYTADQQALSNIGKPTSPTAGGVILSPNFGIGGGYTPAISGNTGVMGKDVQAVLDKYGISPNTIANDTGFKESSLDTGYWGVDPSKYFSQNAAPTLSSVTNADQQAKLNALQSLLGQTGTNFDASQAGKYDANSPGTFDTSAYNSAVNSAKGAYQQQAGTLLGQIQAAAASAPSYQQANIPTLQKNIQGYFDQLNAIRSQYGLGSLVNPYPDQLSGAAQRGNGLYAPGTVAPGSGTAPRRGGL